MSGSADKRFQLTAGILRQAVDIFKKFVKPLGRGRRESVLDLADIVFHLTSIQPQVGNEKLNEVIVAVRNFRGYPSPRRGQFDSLPHGMPDKAEPGKPLDRPRDGRKPGAKFGGNIGHAYLRPGLFEPVDDFNIILLCSG